MQKWPGDHSRCIVEAKDGSCICVDPCVVLGLPRYNDFGNEIQGSGCEECVRHKNMKHLHEAAVGNFGQPRQLWVVWNKLRLCRCEWPNRLGKRMPRQLSIHYFPV